MKVVISLLYSTEERERGQRQKKGGKLMNECLLLKYKIVHRHSWHRQMQCDIK